MVFCVGVEKYQHEEQYDKLKSVGEDAFAVWNALKAVTDFDDKRSVLRIADRDPTGALLPEDPVQRPSTIGRNQLIDDLEKFLVQATNENDLVVIYLGGHGALKKQAEDLGVSFLPSDFKETPGGWRRNIPVSTLLTKIDETLSARPTIETVFLGNYCHAGAVGQMGDGDFSQDRFASSSKKDASAVSGDVRIAYIPACAGSKSTYERSQTGGRSEYVYYLDKALRGAAGDSLGTITASGVLSYIRKELADEGRGPVELPGFYGEIKIGKTLKQEARMRRLLGNGALSVCLDQPAKHQEYLAPLAEHYFARCAEIQSSTKFSNLFSQLQCRLTLAEVRTDMDKRSGAADLIDDLVAESGRLLGGQAGSPLVKQVAQMNNAMASATNSSFYGFIAMAESSAGFHITPSQNVRSWERALRARPGCLSVDLCSPEKPSADSSYTKIDWRNLDELELPQDTPAGTTPALCFVYSGSCGLISDGTEDSGARERNRIEYPVDPAELWTLARSWPGPFILVWDAPFGGYLKNVPPDLVDRVSLLLTAGQTNGMTFGSPFSDRLVGSTKIMVDFVSNGLYTGWSDAAYKQHLLEYPQSIADDVTWVAGRPEWIGRKFPAFWGEGNSLLAHLDAIRRRATPLHWWADSLAVGNSAEVEEDWIPDRLHRALLGPPSSSRERESELQSLSEEAADEVPEIHMRLGVEAESAMKSQEASDYFEQYVNLVHQRLDETSEPHPDTLVRDTQAKARQLLRSSTELLSGKRSYEYLDRPDRIHLVTVGAEDYQSPLIGDLSGTLADLDLWFESITETFAPVTVTRYFDHENRSSDRIRELLQEALHNAQRDDLVMFVFNGRGLQYGENRFLITEETDPGSVIDAKLHEARMQKPLVISTLEASDGGFSLSVNELARMFKDSGNYCVGIFDCQFTMPTSAEKWPLNKHLFSTYSGLFSRDVPAESEERRPDSLGTVVLDQGESDTNPIFVWWSGPLTNGVVSTTATSIFGRSLVSSILESKSSSYDEWLGNAYGKIPEREKVGHFVLQGPAQRPVMSVGKGLDRLRLLQSQYPRKRRNLDLAIHVAEEGVKGLLSKPLDHLTLGALYSCRADMKTKSYGDSSESIAADYNRAEQQFAQLEQDLRLLKKQGLRDLYIHWFSQTLVNAGKADEALHRMKAWLRETKGSILNPSTRVILEDVVLASISEDRNSKVREVIDAVNSVSRDSEPGKAVTQRLEAMLFDPSIEQSPDHIKIVPEAEYLLVEEE